MTASACFIAFSVWMTGWIPVTDRERAAEVRALNYLGREVPRWAKDNHCYSCHNNGDAARALYSAVRLHWPIKDEVLHDTNQWLQRPDRWDHNGGDEAFSDKGMARLQFATTLLEAIQAGVVKDKKALETAAAGIAKEQRQEGCWRGEGGESLGSPAAYGSSLATASARRLLHSVDSDRFCGNLKRADRWLTTRPVKTVADAAAILYGLADVPGEAALAQRRTCCEFLAKGQSGDGGWGPYVTSASEAFDTALVLLALAPRQAERDVASRIRRGQEFLFRTQKAGGYWQESTRPAGAESYAQRLSTTGWALSALLATRKVPR